MHTTDTKSSSSHRKSFALYLVDFKDKEERCNDKRNQQDDQAR